MFQFLCVFLKCLTGLTLRLSRLHAGKSDDHLFEETPEAV